MKMKKLSLLSLILLFLVACEGEVGPMGPQGPPGNSANGVQWKIVELTINPEDWKLVDGGKENELNTILVASKSIAEITENVYWEGAIIAYYYPFAGDHKFKTSLPYVTHHGEEDAEGDYLWTETLLYVVGEETIDFYLTYSDFLTENRPNKNMDFDLVLIW